MDSVTGTLKGGSSQNNFVIENLIFTAVTGNGCLVSASGVSVARHNIRTTEKRKAV